MSFIMPFDPRGFHWTSPAGSVGQFRPTWPVQIFAWRESEPEPTEYRPAARRMKVARIVTGAGSRETAETVDTLVRAVRRVGAKSFADERGTPFFVTIGAYALWSGKRWKGERGVAAFVLNSRRDSARVFSRSVLKLAEELARAFARSEVIVQIQVAGLEREIRGVVP